MYLTNTARPLTFAIPAVGATALLPQQAAAGTIARIKQMAPGYFNVAVQAVEGGELRHYVVRAAGRFEDGTTEGYWIVERPGQDGHEKVAQFKPSRQRLALEYAVRYLTVDWVNEVGNAA